MDDIAYPSTDASQVRICDPSYLRQILRRLPLADAVLHLLTYSLDANFLAMLYEKHRGRSYEDTLSFPRLVELLTDALTIHGGSGRKMLDQAMKDERLPTCKEAFYGKLRRLPLDVSIAFLTQASQRLNDLLPVQDNPLPACLRHYHVCIIDGKKTKHVAKRLQLTRTQAGQLFGSKLLVGYDPATRLIQNAAAHLDGETNDNPLVPDLLAALHRRPGTRPRLIVADAQFCDLVQITRYHAGGDHFALRYHPKLHFHADPTRPKVEFRDSQGRLLIEEYGWLGSPQDKRRCYVRRVTWKRTHHKDMSVVTDLTNRQPSDLPNATDEPEPISAEALIDLYRLRWRIETVFQEVTTVFGLKKLIGSTAEATAFQAALCMVLYNAIQVVRSYLATNQSLPVDDVSNAMLFDSIRRELIAVTLVVPHRSLAAAITAPPTPEAMRAYLRERLQGVWQKLWKKARNPNPRRYGEKPKGSGAHTSVHRVLQEHKQSLKAAEDSG